MYEYEATVIRVVDGDTFDADVDLGFHMRTRQRFRLMGYNSPEKRGPERELGKVAAEDLLRRLPIGSVVTVKTHKGDAFGRYLADVETPMGDLVTRLIDDGYGAFWDGKGKRPGFDPQGEYPLR